jgi:hypothetical protein
MNGTSNFSGFPQGGPTWIAMPSIDRASVSIQDSMPLVSQVYAAAWTMAQRDHELDLLFNAEYYTGRDI